jgi:CRP/FNR family transcriptional regulator, cyclic AMP receptor protein
MEDLSGILRNHPFLKDLDEEYLKQIVGCASNVAFSENEVIFREGDEAEKFYLVRTGEVALELNGRDKGDIRILTIGPGQILGWSWIISPYKWHFNAMAIEDTRVIALDCECLRNKCETDSKLGYEMLKRFSHILEQRLYATRMQLLDIYKRV